MCNEFFIPVWELRVCGGPAGFPRRDNENSDGVGLVTTPPG